MLFQHVLSALSAAGITLNPDKCSFRARDIKFLRHWIDVEGMHPHPKRVEAIAGYPRPDSTTKVRAFLRMTYFYRKFVYGFSNITQPLHDLLKKYANMIHDWSQRQEDGFSALKKKQVSALVLAQQRVQAG